MKTFPDLIGRPARVLVVDDERENRELLRVLLGAEGCDLLSASNGAEALAAVAAQHPDLILLDVMMAGMDGYEVVARLKGDVQTRNIPVIIVTSLDDGRARMLALSAGAEDFLTKPVDRAELCVRVRNLLRLKAYGDVHDHHSQILEREVVARTADLRHEADRAQRYLDTAQVVLLALDTHGDITLVNRYACDVLGWSANELIGRNWIDTCVVPRTRATARTWLDSLLIGDVSVSENFIVTRAGDERLMEWRNTVVRNDAGVVTGTFSSGTDITEQQRAVGALRNSEERTRFALKNASVGLWDMDYSAGMVRWSDIIEEQHGLAAGTFGGTVDAFLERIHPDDRDTVRETMHAAAQSGEDFSLEYRVFDAHGAQRWLCGTGRFRRISDGSGIRGVGISQDITARRLLESQYRQAQKMDAIGQLASGVAHDFNNLLAVILGFAELMSLDVNEEDAHGTELSEIIKAANRAAALTKHLLAFSRQQVFHSVPVDVNALVTDMTGMLAMLMGGGITLEVDLAPAVSPAIADRGQLEQVLMNLVLNARDAMPNGGALLIETTDVDLETAIDNEESVVRGQYVMIAITDSGAGMTKEVQRRLFEPFFTTKELGKGTGLGLSTAYGIVKQSKGYIWVISEVGEGTTFKVCLPRSLQAVPLPDDTWPPATSERNARETVLLVEDEDSVRQLARRILERSGYHVLEAASGDEAEASFLRHEGAIDLVVTDMVMPGCSGVELLNRLWARVPTLKALYMSGYGALAEQTTENASRGLPIIQKPFTAAELERKVRLALAQ